MIYEYECCEVFEVIKSLAEIDRPEKCVECGKPARRIISKSNFYGADDWDNAQFCPGLGQYVKSNKHRAKLAKDRGLEEVGNEDMGKVINAQEHQRRKEADERLDDAAKDAFNHGFGA